MRTLRVFVFSDLHINARGSRFAEIEARLHEEIAKSDIIVLNGDIIEMFFPEHLAGNGSIISAALNTAKNWISLVKNTLLHGDTYDAFYPKEPNNQNEILQAYIDAAKDGAEWVEALLKQYPDKKFMYLEGNHENCKFFRDNIHALRKKHSNLTWGRTYMSIGNGHFFHGDNEIRNEDVEKREKAQLEDVHSGKLHESVNLTGEMPAMWAMRIWNGNNKIVDRIDSFLKQIDPKEQINPDRLKTIKHMFFGHTHLPFLNFFRHGKFWHNTGSASRFGKDNFLSFELEVPDGCEFKTDDKRVFYPEAKIENVRRVDIGGKFTEMVGRDTALATSR